MVQRRVLIMLVALLVGGAVFFGRSAVVEFQNWQDTKERAARVRREFEGQRDQERNREVEMSAEWSFFLDGKTIRTHRITKKMSRGGRSPIIEDPCKNLRWCWWWWEVREGCVDVTYNRHVTINVCEGADLLTLSDLGLKFESMQFESPSEQAVLLLALETSEVEHRVGSNSPEVRVQVEPGRLVKVSLPGRRNWGSTGELRDLELEPVEGCVFVFFGERYFQEVCVGQTRRLSAIAEDWPERIYFSAAETRSSVRMRPFIGSLRGG